MNVYLIISTLCALAILSGKNISASRGNDASDTDAGNAVEEPLENEPDDSDVSGDKKLNSTQKDYGCWMSLDSQKHFQIMDEMDEHYRKVRTAYQKQVADELDTKMLKEMLAMRGIAEREFHKTKGFVQIIPAGLNLGGYCMMRMKNSILFFHRMKLRNDTHFRVNFLQNDLVDMTLIVRLSLHDLHLVGAYERSPTDKDPSILFYAPSYGEVEFLLKNVDYKMEGRLRLLKDRLIIELVISDLVIEDILMSYLSKDLPDKPVRLKKENLEDFLERMKTDLDKWLIDYFNDYLMFSTAVDTANQGFMQAEKDKMIVLNEFADGAINKIKNRIRKLGGHVAKIPNFSIFGTQRTLIRLRDGYLRGLDTMYRRSVATGKKEKKFRKLDLIVGFSNLKLVYKYEAVLGLETPPLTGLLILSADELTTHMGLTLVKDPETVDMEFDFIRQMKPESLTVEGPANRMIANFKHLLEHHIIAIMSNTLIHTIKTLKSLPKCEPMLFKFDEHNAGSNDLEDGDFGGNTQDSFVHSLVHHRDKPQSLGGHHETDHNRPIADHTQDILTDSAVRVPSKGKPNKQKAKNNNRQDAIKKNKIIKRKINEKKFKVANTKNLTLKTKPK